MPRIKQKFCRRFALPNRSTNNQGACESHILIHSLSKQAEEAVRSQLFSGFLYSKGCIRSFPKPKTVRNRHLADSCWKGLALPRDSQNAFFIRSAGQVPVLSDAVWKDRRWPRS